MVAATEIDAEDEGWNGQIDQRIFLQVQEKEEKARIVAKLEAQNRPTQMEKDKMENSKDGSKGGYPHSVAEKKEGLVDEDL